jgi:hypothetical protein
MYLKNENAIVAEYLRKRLDPDAPEATDMDDIRITDYDGRLNSLFFFITIKPGYWERINYNFVV